MRDLSHVAWVNSRRCYTPRELTHASLLYSKVKFSIWTRQYNFIKNNKIYLISWLLQFLQNGHVFWNGGSIIFRLKYEWFLQISNDILISQYFFGFSLCKYKIFWFDPWCFTLSSLSEIENSLSLYIGLGLRIS